MAIDSGFLKRSVTPSSVFGAYIPTLKRAGRGVWKGLCPFHLEKTASFMCWDDGHYKCFGCGAGGGDVIAFIQEAEACDFKESVDILQRDFGGIRIDAEEERKVQSRLRSIQEWYSGKVQKIDDVTAMYIRLSLLAENSSLISDKTSLELMDDLQQLNVCMLKLKKIPGAVLAAYYDTRDKNEIPPIADLRLKHFASVFQSTMNEQQQKALDELDEARMNILKVLFEAGDYCDQQEFDSWRQEIENTCDKSKQRILNAGRFVRATP